MDFGHQKYGAWMAGLLCLFAANAWAQLTCEQLDGARVYSPNQQSQYLGFLGTSNADGSLNNPFDEFGNRFSDTSVRNLLSPFGNNSGDFSANNPNALSPPVIVVSGAVIGFLTANPDFSPGVSVADLDAACQFFSQAPRAAFTVDVGGFDSSVMGTWFNPQRDGEGFILDFVLVNGQLAFVVYFFTYDPDGNPIFLVGPDPEYDPIAGTIIANVNMARGARFGPDFDPDDVVRTRWGTITIQFTSCTTAVASWESLLPEFADGTSDLIKPLTNPGISCPPGLTPG